MDSVSDRILGMRFHDAQSLLLKEEVDFAIEYTEAHIKKDFSGSFEKEYRIIRAREKDEGLELLLCKV